MSVAKFARPLGGSRIGAAFLLVGPVILLSVAPISAGGAATIAPPMLDISHQCGAGRRDERAMSECVVAESEARSDILQKWDRLADASVEKCMTTGRKVRKLPYSTLAKCLASEPLVAPAPPKPAEAAASTSTPGPNLAEFATWKHFFSSGK